MLKVVDANGNLIIKAPMAQNIAFKVEMKVMEHRCLAMVANKEEG